MFSMPTTVIVLGIVLIIFGPGKIPEIGSALGKGLQSLRKATEDKDDISAKAAEKEKPEGNDKV